MIQSLNPDIWSNKYANKHVMVAIRTVNASNSITLRSYEISLFMFCSL